VGTTAAAIHADICLRVGICLPLRGRVRVGTHGGINTGVVAVDSHEGIIAHAGVARPVGRTFCRTLGHRCVFPAVWAREIGETPYVGAANQAADPTPEDDPSHRRAHGHHHPRMLKPAPAVPTVGATDTLWAFGPKK
jgi:hypothetical protein